MLYISPFDNFGTFFPIFFDTLSHHKPVHLGKYTTHVFIYYLGEVCLVYMVFNVTYLEHIPYHHNTKSYVCYVQCRGILVASGEILMGRLL